MIARILEWLANGPASPAHEIDSHRLGLHLRRHPPELDRNLKRRQRRYAAWVQQNARRRMESAGAVAVIGRIKDHER